MSIPDGLGLELLSNQSTAADDDQIRVETCSNPCGINRSDEAASTAADDDQMTKAKLNPLSTKM